MLSIHHYHHFPEIPAAGFGVTLSAAGLATITAYLARIEKDIAHMTGQLDGLRAAVERTTGVVASAVALIHGLSDRLKELPDPDGEIATLTAALEADASALGTAVAAAPLPGEPVPEPEPEPEPVPPEPTPEPPPAST
jgi:hypothetical protein